MQFVDDISPADLNGVGIDAHSTTDSRAVRPATVPKLIVRCLAVPLGLASIAALALEGALSMAGYGVAKLLGKFLRYALVISFFPRLTIDSSNGLGNKFCGTIETPRRYESWSL